MKNFDEILKELGACFDAKEWAEGKDFQTVWATCDRGDWLGWLVDELKFDKQLRVLVAGHCANTVRHLMTDERSTNAIDVAIRYGNGEAMDEELQTARAAAWAANAAIDVAWEVANAARAATVASAVNAAMTASDAASYAGASWWDNQLQTADIIRKYITSEMMIEKLEILYP